MGTLFIVSTPIGNLGDITVRALEVLRSVGVVAAEDTRHTRKLLAHYQIHARMLSYNEHSPASRTNEILALCASGDVALVTDAGTPGVSDPGQELVSAARAAGIPVSALPGPSAAITALVLSGLPTSPFLFLGFLPRRTSHARTRLLSFAQTDATIGLYEAPHRLRATLTVLHEVLGDRPVSVARELTKVHEEVRGSTLVAEREYWGTTEPRGEFTIIVGPAEAAVERPGDSLVAALSLVQRRVAEGVKASQAVREVSEAAGVRRKELYTLWLQRGCNPPQ